MSQTTFAKLVGCAPSYIQAVEILRRALSEDRALRISAETGIAPRWLRSNDLTKPMVEVGTGRPYTRATFERAQAKKFAPSGHRRKLTHSGLLNLTALLWSCVSSAEKRGPEQGTMALYRLERFVNEFVGRFGLDDWVYDGKDPGRALKIIAKQIMDFGPSGEVMSCTKCCQRCWYAALPHVPYK